MNHSKDLDNPRFTAYAAGELDSGEMEAFEAMLADPCARKELDDTEAMMSLLKDAFSDELATSQAVDRESTLLTSYALGELEDDELDTIESQIAGSEEFAAELAGIEEMMGLLSSSLDEEWRSRESIDLDVPAFTDYALGELSGVEADEFEAKIKYSAEAKKELGETHAFVSLLSEGLEKEWKSELSAPDHEFSLVEATGEENVVSVNFAQASQSSARAVKNRGPILISLAAVLAGLLVVGGMLSNSGSGNGNLATASITPMGFSSDNHEWFDPGDKPAEVAKAPVESPFNLQLLDELNQPIEDFELADVDMVDVSAFDPAGNSGMMNVSLDTSIENSPALRAPYSLVGSYFPQEKSGESSYAIRYGLVDGNSARSFMLMDRLHHNDGLESVIYQGILTFPAGADFDTQDLMPFKADADQMSGADLSTVYLGLRSEIKSLADSINHTPVDANVLRVKLNDLLERYGEPTN